jgi:hypothetical protein
MGAFAPNRISVFGPEDRKAEPAADRFNSNVILLRGSFLKTKFLSFPAELSISETIDPYQDPDACGGAGNGPQHQFRGGREIQISSQM